MKNQTEHNPTSMGEVNLKEPEFDRQFRRLASEIKILYQIKKPDVALKYQCVVDFFERDFRPDHKMKLSRQIHDVGFNKIKNAFQVLNRECENLLCENEDLLGILKKHLFNQRPPENDNQMIRQTGQFIHVTLIYLNVLKNKKITGYRESFLQAKNEALLVINPVIEVIFNIISELMNENKFHRKFETDI